MLKSILIDATHIEVERPTGVEIYVRALLPLLSQKLVDTGISVSWVGHGKQPSCMPESVTWVQSEHTPLWSQVGLRTLLRTLRPSLYFTPSGIPPLKSPVPTVMTVHDISFYDFPEAYSKQTRFRLRRLMPIAGRAASLILTPSAYVRDEIALRWKLKPAHIRVTPLAASLSADEEVIEGLPEGKRISVFGRIETKKNLIPVIAAVASMKGYVLVLAGKDGVGAKAIHAAVAELPVEARARICLAGYVTDAQKNWLLRQSDIICVPGRSEGFGIPVLEGFAAGKPVVAAGAGSLPEVAGSAACLVHGNRPSDWAAAFKSGIGNQTLGAAGYERGQSFTWETCAELTAKVLVNAMS
jgi:glycosyltransferase involved in cell wall biosynthesis